MPRTRDGYSQLSTMVPTEALRAVEAVAAATGRSLAQEVAHALERHAANPPTVKVLATPHPPAEVEAPPPKPKRSRRKPS